MPARHRSFMSSRHTTPRIQLTIHKMHFYDTWFTRNHFCPKTQNLWADNCYLQTIKNSLTCAEFGYNIRLAIRAQFSRQNNGLLNLEQLRKKFRKKPQKSAVFLMFVRRTLATIFGKKCAFFMLFIAFYCPFFCKSYTLTYATPRHTCLHTQNYGVFTPHFLTSNLVRKNDIIFGYF